VTEPGAEAEIEVAAPPEPAPSASTSQKRAGDKPRAGEDPTQVAEAVRALRKQGDFARAQALLDQYLKNNPRGALAEDALALSIEAAAARKDPRAADYARRYLARYPNGRFRAVAERALSR
jgi:TolA-binding protein